MIDWRSIELYSRAYGSSVSPEQVTASSIRCVEAETAFYSRKSVLHLRDTVISTSIVSLSQRLQTSEAYGAKVALTHPVTRQDEDGAVFVIF
jgi:hypothetical protein